MINQEPQSKKLHILMLASGADTHTIRWVNALSEKGFDISLASLHGYSKTISCRVNQIQLTQKLPFGYFTARYELAKFIKNERVDIVHAHYATGYGSLGRLLNAERYILSVWGSDVLIFPEKRTVHPKRIRDRPCPRGPPQLGGPRGIFYLEINDFFANLL